MGEDRVIMTEFLNKYRDFRCLWDTAYEGYSNKVARDQALVSLLHIYQKIHPNATLLTMKRKIDNMRTAYKREVKKVKEAMAGAGTIYIPRLWYYGLLTFLDEKSMSTRQSRDTMSQEDEEEYVTINVSHDFAVTATNESGAAVAASPRPQKRMKMGGRSDPVEKAAVMLEKVMEKQLERKQQNDSVADFGKFVVSKLKDLPPYNRAVATKRIYEVLYEEELKALGCSNMMTQHMDVTG